MGITSGDFLTISQVLNETHNVQKKLSGKWLAERFLNRKFSLDEETVFISSDGLRVLDVYISTYFERSNQFMVAFCHNCMLCRRWPTFVFADGINVFWTLVQTNKCFGNSNWMERETISTEQFSDLWISSPGLSWATNTWVIPNFINLFSYHTVVFIVDYKWLAILAIIIVPLAIRLVREIIQ